MKRLLIVCAVLIGGFFLFYLELLYLILMAVLINITGKVTWEYLKPKITGFELVPCLTKTDILLFLDIAFETKFPLTSLTIEEFVNQERLKFRINNPTYDKENKRLQICYPMTCCVSPSSYIVTVENTFRKDSSKRVQIYLFFKCFGDIDDSRIMIDRSTQTMFTSVMKNDLNKMSSLSTSEIAVDEFTFLNLDPEPCSRSGCSGSGFNNCKLCSAPYCSSRCKSKDYRNHKKQCPNIKLEERQRLEQEQQYELCIKSQREEIERLKDHGLCKICLEEEARVVFDPCGHLCCCFDCSVQLRACPMCREDVQKIIKVFT